MCTVKEEEKKTIHVSFSKIHLGRGYDICIGHRPTCIDCIGIKLFYIIKMAIELSSMHQVGLLHDTANMMTQNHCNGFFHPFLSLILVS